MSTLPEILSVEKTEKPSLFEVESVHLKFSNGQERVFERFSNKSRRAVMILPLLDSETLLLIREYGVGLEDYHLSLPKGGIEKGESSLDCAQRELKEEVGYSAQKWTPLRFMSSSPGYSRAQMDVMIAEDLSPDRIQGDEPEPIEVVPWPLANLEELLQHEQLHEARALAALLLFARMRGL